MFLSSKTGRYPSAATSGGLAVNREISILNEACIGHRARCWRMPIIGLTLALAFAAMPAFAQLRCAAFDNWPPAMPEPRVAPDAVATFNRINRAVKTQPYQVLFLGDSITERWQMPVWDAKRVWEANMTPRGVLNAGVSGDRTEHLRWRLDHGNLNGPAPKGVVVLIGTNDLGHGRPPAEAAEGIRATLIQLRQKLPSTRILLLGLWPRGATPADPLRQGTVAVNRLIPAWRARSDS